MAAFFRKILDARIEPPSFENDAHVNADASQEVARESSARALKRSSKDTELRLVIVRGRDREMVARVVVELRRLFRTLDLNLRGYATTVPYSESMVPWIALDMARHGVEQLRHARAIIAQASTTRVIIETEDNFAPLGVYQVYRNVHMPDLVRRVMHKTLRDAIYSELPINGENIHLVDVGEAEPIELEATHDWRPIYASMPRAHQIDVPLAEDAILNVKHALEDAMQISIAPDATYIV